MYLMSPNMTGIPSLWHDSSIRPNRTICINLMTAVCLVIIFALLALETGIHLRTNSNPWANFDQRYLWPNTNSGADNFMPAAERPVLGAPSTTQCMDIWAANAACLDFHVNIKILKWFRFELNTELDWISHRCPGTYFSLDEFRWPWIGPVNLEPGERFWIHHFCCYL